jgi:hypothetical protein
MTKNMLENLGGYLEKEWKAVSYVFLGVFLLLFAINLSAMLSFLPVNYSAMAFNISVFASVLAIVYIVYILHEKK